MKRINSYTIFLQQLTFFIGFTIIIYAAAFALYMIYEAPLAALLKILYYRNFK